MFISFLLLLARFHKSKALHRHAWDLCNRYAHKHARQRKQVALNHLLAVTENQDHLDAEYIAKHRIEYFSAV
jgi:hypothetical protein